MKKILTLVILLQLVSCDKNEVQPEAQPLGFEIPLVFNLNGNANGTYMGNTIDCYCQLIGELESASQAVNNDTIIYTGFLGGHLERKVLDGNGDGYALHPDVFSAITLKIFEDSIWILNPINETADSRFYKELALMKGVIKDGNVQGIWTCAPFDITEGGWIDVEGFAEGEWTITATE